MDLGMPFAQRQAWNALKKAANEYAGVTGSEVAVVTTYLSTKSPQAVDNAPVVGATSLAMHGHGDLLRRVRESMDKISLKKRTVSQTSTHSIGNGWGASPTVEIPIKQVSTQGEQTHYNQAVARSLCSSFRSLKLDQNPDFLSQMNSSAERARAGQEPKSSPAPVGRRSGKRGGSKKSHVVNGDVDGSLELDENLLFDEPSYGTSGDENEDDDEFGDSDDDSTDVSENSFGHVNSHFPTRIIRAPPTPLSDPNQFATSLPVNININWGQRSDGPPRFRDNQGPHPPLHQRQQPQPPPAAQFSTQSSRPSQRSQDTPNPETMMASIEALARSVTDDSALIFGERPRPRLNTGESRMTHVRR